LSFLSAAFGLFIDPALVDQVQALIQSHGAGLSAAMGAQSEPIRHTMDALQKYHAAAFASGQVSTDQIEVAFLLGQGLLNRYIQAISVGAVFFGAATYIGNGPNFMVRAIAERQNIRMPSFLGFVFKHALPCLAPMLVLIWLLFFRR